MSKMKLGLGTVQFGLDYGISNTAGQTARNEVGKMLELAHSRGVRVLDTAPAYGNSEKVIGEVLAQQKHDYAIVTKTPHFEAQFVTKNEAAQLERVCLESLDDLQIPALYGLLMHNPEDLLVDGAELLVERMLALRERGLIRKWGVSVYTGGQIEQILEKFTPDLVQVPINVLDQRLINGGQLGKLKGLGIEIHARSIFLQGVLLSDPAELNNYFAPWQTLLKGYRDNLARIGLTPLEAALSFVNDLPEIDRVIVGACSVEELSQILDIFVDTKRPCIDFSEWATADEQLLNPAHWAKSSA